jgi:hypothetical protein
MGLEEWCEAYDPPRVGWQNEQLYRIEHARRALRRARDEADFAARWHQRYEDEARQRAVALKVAQEARREAAAREAAYRASPEGLAEKERLEEKRRQESEWVRQVCATEEEVNYRRKESWLKPKLWHAVENRGRVIDMGGPRDVWLHYGVAADPRLDNMEPVR